MAAFTTIAAAGGLVATLAGTGMSFANASKQGALARQAKADADAAIAKARGELQRNFQKQRAIIKQPYESEREALLSSGAQAIQAGVESGQAAQTAGRVQMAMNDAQQGVTDRMSQEYKDIDKSIINEDSRLRDIGVQLDLEEVAGANTALKDAKEAQALATQQAMEGVKSSVAQGAAFIPLFSQNISAQKSAVGNMNMSNEDFQKFGNVGGKTMGAPGAEGFTNLDLGSIANMSNSQFRQFKRDLTPEQSRMLFQNDQYINNYNPFQY